MPATEPTTADIPRAVRHRIVSMLARLMYPAERIARENHVTVEIVEALRAEHGPGVKELCEAAEWLARPAKADKPKPTPTTGDGLASTEERRECRAWAITTGRTTAGVGPLSRSIVDAWEAAGRPVVAVTPKPVPKPEPTPEPEPDPEPIAAQEQQPDDELIDAEIVDEERDYWLALVAETYTNATDALLWAAEAKPELIEQLVDHLRDFTTTAAIERGHVERLNRATAALLKLCDDGVLLANPTDLREAARAVLEAAA